MASCLAWRGWTGKDMSLGEICESKRNEAVPGEYVWHILVKRCGRWPDAVSSCRVPDKWWMFACLHKCQNKVQRSSKEESQWGEVNEYEDSVCLEIWCRYYHLFNPITWIPMDKLGGMWTLWLLRLLSKQSLKSYFENYQEICNLSSFLPNKIDPFSKIGKWYFKF
jgi:hypothetical protein